MLRYVLLFVFITIIYAADTMKNEKPDFRAEVPINMDMGDEEIERPTQLDVSIREIEQIVAAGYKIRRERLISLDETDELNKHKVKILDKIISSIIHFDNTNEFLNSRGIERLILPHIGSHDPEVTKRILTVIKTLFEVHPNETDALMPINLVDKMLDVFENSESLDFKEMAIDILCLWLPNNPKLQARVMKLKGLEPFYHQMSKLSVSINHKLLSLFNTILKEHVAARSNFSLETQANDDHVKLYQMIGLLERMSTPLVCNGILNIFQILTSKENKSFQLPIIELMKHVRTFCFEVYKGKKKAINIFDNFYKILSNEQAVTALEELGLNITDIKVDIKTYVTRLRKKVRTEL